MAFEIERKFLVKGEFIHLAERKCEMVQRYLIKDAEKTIRIRIKDQSAELTIKGSLKGSSLTRSEWNIPLAKTDAEEMMALCLPGLVSKTRHYIPSGDHTFEVDVFHGANDGLIIAEIELNSETEIFEKPAWLGEEVTGNPIYYNANLIK